MSGKVLVNDGENGEDVFFAGRLFEKLVVDAEDSDEELASEREVEFGVLSDEFCDER